MLRGFLLAVLLAWSLTCPTPASAERRVALLIGNGAYAEAPLRNPVNDARAMAAVLRELDFDVTLLENADRPAMQRASLEFCRKLKDDVAGLFYFAGHGMQVRGANYLIPINAQVGSEEEVEVEAMDVNYILARMATARNKFNIVILDACRNNPFERSFRSSASGLAAISAPRGTLIAYATAPGSVAADGQGANGLYTGELIAALKTPNLPLEQTFKQARAEVVMKSSGRQTPWESSSVIGNFVFRPQAAAPVASAADSTLWNAVKDSSNPADYRAYLQAHPQGFYAVLARGRLDEVSRSRDAEMSQVARDAAIREATEKATKEAAIAADTALWNAVKDSSDPTDYQAYLQARPEGAYAALARSRMVMLERVRDTEISRIVREAADRAAREALTQAKQAEAAAAAARQAEAKQAQATVATAKPQDAGSERQKPVVVASINKVTQPATAPVFADNTASFVNTRWKAIERAVSAHFNDLENYWFYKGQIRPPGTEPLTLHKVTFYEITSSAGEPVEIMMLLRGEYPFSRNIYTGGFQSFTTLVKYQFEQEGNELVVSSFLPVPKSYLTAGRPKETDGRMTP